MPFAPSCHNPLNLSWLGTTQVSRYQKGKTNLDFTEARDSEWQWHQLGHMQVCTSIQTDNHASIPPLLFTGHMPFLLPNQPMASKHSRLDILAWDRHRIMPGYPVAWLGLSVSST